MFIYIDIDLYVELHKKCKLKKIHILVQNVFFLFFCCCCFVPFSYRLSCFCFVVFVYFKIIGSYANNFVYISTSVSKLTAKHICNNYAILALGNRV